MPSASEDRFRQSWKLEELSGRPAQAWLIVRRTVATLLAIGLLIFCGWLIYRLFQVPSSYLAYWSASAYEPLSAGPVKYAYGDYTEIESLKGSFLRTDLANPADTPLTKKSLEERLLALADLRMYSRDACLVFVTAHGRVSNHEAVLLCEPGGPGSEKAVSEVLESLKKVPAGTKLLILDAGRDELATDDSADDDLFPALLEKAVKEAGDPSLWVLTANAALERSHVSVDLSRPVFGYMVWQGLRGQADLDKNGEIGIDELYKYVQSEVSARVKMATGGGDTQTPQLLHYDAEKHSSEKVAAHRLINTPEESSEPIPVKPTPETATEGKSGRLRDVVSQLSKQVKDQLSVKEELHIGSQILGLHGHDEEGEHGDEGAAHDAHASGASGEHGGTEHKNAAHDAKAEAKIESVEAARKQVSIAWKKVARLESSTDRTSPGVVAPPAWRALLEQILWCDQFCASGVPADAKDSWNQVANELGRIDESLKDFAAYRAPTYLEPARMNALAGQGISFAIADRMAVTAPDMRLTKQLTDFIAKYDVLLFLEPPATFKSKLNAALLAVQKEDLGLENYYEFQLLKLSKEFPSLALNNDSDVTSEMLQLVLRTRRIGEKVAVDPLCGEGWSRKSVEDADRLRSEGERELLDRTSDDWEEQATLRLKAANAGYDSAFSDLKVIRSIIQDRNAALLRAPDLVHLACLDAGGDEDIAAVQNVFSSLRELNKKLANPVSDLRKKEAGSAKSSIEVLQGLHEQLKISNDKIGQKADTENNAWRMANLLATTIPESKLRDQLRDKLEATEHAQMDSGKAPETDSEAFTASAINNKQWKQVRGEFDLQVELAELAGYDGAAKLRNSLEDKETDRINKLRKAREDLAKLMVEAPAALSATTKKSGEVAPVSIADLRDALSQWLMLGPRRLDQLDKDNLIARLDRASWHNLLDWNTKRFRQAAVDAPLAIDPNLRKVSETFRTIANEIQKQPGISPSEQPTLSIESKDEVSLLTSDEDTVTITVNSSASKDERIWLTAQYNKKWLAVDPGVHHQHELPAKVDKEKDLGEEASRYPLRPDKLRLDPTGNVPAGKSSDFTVTINRLDAANAGGVTKLIVKAMSGDTLVRRELAVNLPGKKSLDIAVNAPPECWDAKADALRPLPNRVQNFSFDVKGEKVEKDVVVSIWAPTNVPSEEKLAEIPSGAIDRDSADQILKPFGLLQLGPDFPIKLPASGALVGVKLAANDATGEPPANLLLRGADPKTFKPIPLSYGLLIRMADKQTNQVTIRRIKITPQRPDGFLEAYAQYDRSTELLEINVQATNSAVLPVDGLKISANVFGASDQGNSSLAGTLKGPSNKVRLFTELVPAKSLDTKTTAYVDVDNYPRAFVFKIPRNVSGPDIRILPETNLREVRIVSPKPGKAYAPVKNLTKVKVKAEIDAPQEFRDGTVAKGSPPRVEIGIDQKQQRSLDEGDPVAIRHSDRQVTVTAKSLSPDGSLELDTEVGDFEVDLATGLKNKRVTLLGRLVIDETSTWSDEEHSVEIALDGAPPVVDADFPPQPGIVPTKELRKVPQVLSGEDLLVHVFMSPEDEKLELSGVQKVQVQAAFVTEATNDSKPAKPEIGAPYRKAEWIVKLSTKDEKLGLGNRSVRITATDNLGNESKPLFKPVEIVAKPGNAAPAPANVNNAKNPALANDVSGTVQFGDTGVPSKVELIAAAGPPIKPIDTDASGAFKFSKVPPGKYTLTVTTTEALQNYKRKALKEIEVPPSPQKFAPINVKVK